MARGKVLASQRMGQSWPLRAEESRNIVGLFVWIDMLPWLTSDEFNAQYVVIYYSLHFVVYMDR